ncbi:unnamed protein product [Scytosiphon promiscuus]
MGGAWRRVLACGCGSYLAARGLGNPLESLDREHWVSLDSTATDQATDVATGAGGSMVYISGYRQRAPMGADGTQSIEAFVMAYNSSGFRQWVAEYGSSGEDLGNSVAADATGVYLAGTESVPKNSSSSSSSGGGGGGTTDDTDAFVVKYNTTGGLLWKTSWGTSQPDLGNGVAVDGGSGLVYVVGTTRGSMPSGDVPDGGGSETGDGGEGSAAGQADAVEVNAGMSDVFLSCLSAADGSVQWTRQFGSSAVDVGNRVAVGPRGGVFTVGQLGDDEDLSLAGQRAFLAKYDYLGNAQFTARLNSSSAHYAVDLAPSVGSGGEGVVYMSGYTLGDNPSVFLARFEGSTGTQAWLSELGEETGMPHLAQSVAVVEGSQFGFGLTGGGAGESPGAAGSDGAPVVEGEEATHGDDARIVVVGYNTSAAAAGSHSSTGFTAAADTEGNWAWVSSSEMADRHTAVAIGHRQGAGAGADESVAYIVGTVAAGEASPGNYLFLDIRKVVREGSDTPAPSTSAAVAQDALADPAGGASSTTGLSQGSSLWLLIIAPIFVVLSCILLVSYVSKQCSVAFGTRPPQREPMDAIEYGSGGGGGLSRAVRTSRSLRREKNRPSDWNERSSGSPVNGPSDRRRRRDSGSGSSGHSSGSKGGRKAAWPRSVADAFRDRDEEVPPYRKLGMRERDRGGGGGRAEGRERGQTDSTVPSSVPPLENGEVELRQVTGQSQAPFGYPRGDDSPGGGGRRVRDGDDEPVVSGVHRNVAAFEGRARSNSSGMTAPTGWGAFQGDGMSGDGGRERDQSRDRYLTGRPRREGSPVQGLDPHRLL